MFCTNKGIKKLCINYYRYPWGHEAFEKARNEDKLIFLSVGYSTCHWCHVMERESFENQEIAAIMNAHFVNIKVDREERPDVDSVYMAFVQVGTQYILTDHIQSNSISTTCRCF